ncbi:hypothetical protein HA402_000487 [Bradysia odoriphaga]|nr:hypothetical protein HA402_000487 [Bradysia odoriphaga]
MNTNNRVAQHENFPQSPLSETQAKEYLTTYGYNEIETGKKTPWYKVLYTALVHPFNILLAILATASGIIEDFDTMAIMLVMVTLSSAIRFHQEWKSLRAAQSLLSMVSKKVKVLRRRDSTRNVEEMEIDTALLVPSDWVKLEPGNLIPADLIIHSSKDLYISQASLTGEAIPVEKYKREVVDRSSADDSKSHTEILIDRNPEQLVHQRRKKVRRTGFKDMVKNIFGIQTGLESSDIDRLEMKADLDRPDMCYMGTSVISGMATAIVYATGPRTYFGMMADDIATRRPQNAFQLGVRRISWIFFLTMACLVPPVFLLQGFLHSGWTDALLFSLSVAVGLTPEMLPMIVNTTLAKGAYQLAKRKCIVKSLDAVVNLGGMDVLCTDKTGTLTKSVVTLTRHVNPLGMESDLPLHMAYLNSYFQAVNSSPMDTAVLLFYDSFYFQKSVVSLSVNVPADQNVTGRFEKIDEIPFDFERRKTSVILKEKGEDSKNILICKGAVDEMLSCCTQISTDNLNEDYFIPNDYAITELTPALHNRLKEFAEDQSREGLRILAVAYKKFDKFSGSFDASCENDLTFVGFLAFLDPPKESAAQAIRDLMVNNVKVKVLTGDSSVVCQKICEEIRLPVQRVVTSSDLDGLNDVELSDLAESSTIFSKLTPMQKADIVRALRRNGHIVGFLGDGINDSTALVEADVGISVDSGTDIAKESADIILLEKDLGVVVDGVIFGRSTYGNTLKYIVMAVSSNFGNVFSMLVASSWLPFLPMLPIHVVVQNLLYDISQISIPWDHMDPEFLIVPHRWSMKSVLRFMVWIGPWSSVFDITTFLYMYYYFGIQTPDNDVTLFQTTWFTVGLLTQTLIVHMIRTPKIPFIQSTASLPVILMTVIIMTIGIAIPFIPVFRNWLQMVVLDSMVYPYVAGALLSYAIAAQLAKVIYKRLFNEWF